MERRPEENMDIVTNRGGDRGGDHGGDHGGDYGGDHDGDHGGDIPKYVKDVYDPEDVAVQMRKIIR